MIARFSEGKHFPSSAPWLVSPEIDIKNWPWYRSVSRGKCREFRTRPPSLSLSLAPSWFSCWLLCNFLSGFNTWAQPRQRVGQKTVWSRWNVSFWRMYRIAVRTIIIIIMMLTYSRASTVALCDNRSLLVDTTNDPHMRQMNIVASRPMKTVKFKLVARLKSIPPWFAIALSKK